MSDAANDGFPFELVSDALASVGADGSLLPRNGAMRRLLGALPAGARLADLPLGAVESERLRAGDVVAVSLAGREVELRLAPGTPPWLLAVDRTTADELLSARLAAARVRALGGIAVALVHDLSNLLGAGLGLTELVRASLHDPADLATVDEIERCSRQGATLGRTLARLLGKGPRLRQVTPLGDLVADALAVVGKNAQHRGVELEVAPAPVPSPRVRVVAEEALQALLHGLLLVLDGAARVSVTVATGVRSIAGGRPRRAAFVRIDATPCPTIGVAAEVARGGPGALLRAGALGPAGAGLLHATLSLAGCGGELAVAQNGAGGSLEFAWPCVD